ncbi:MAG: phosphoglucosamine mutase [Ignavibacteriota bacterium]|nr:MAG: phosphoglucosamine mutase [Chlorobiota bacterium]MBE7478125.1 phosphoglucosamine mutase [Ignavibacteriales bacterium]MBL1121646.1 phosphoglucosamine mutase [Ignavibacteriota bacterium]MCC7094830.1 phosphoglucosamine mutase [Ignavibacteriaceae bacterium]QKJ97328.1 MAG: phosphoglucosamine mutase [Ignavibacteriota bacterium]
MATLMSSISGIRGIVGNGLDPEIIIKYTKAYAEFIGSGKVVIGRDARITGEMVNQITTGTLLAKGIDVVDIGICPTPTVQFNVKKLKAQGGIAISASHNPNEWNALKLLNGTGQFLSPAEYVQMQKFLADGQSNYKSWDKIGKWTEYSKGIQNHIDAIFDLGIIYVEEIRKKRFKVLVDCVNGAGAYILPDFLKEFGCEVIEMNCEKTGIFPRTPEPLPENLIETMKRVKSAKVDFGIVVDPDVDRLVLISDKGEPFIEENTITQIVQFILSRKKGNVVVNLSTTRAVDDIAAKYGCSVFRSPVGEANVVKKMKEVNAVIGGEGSGGIIFPELHYGRDALVGIALTLQYLSDYGKSISELKKELPQYFIVKKKIEVTKNPDEVISKLTDNFSNQKINTEDGLRVDFDDHWVHFRKSNTEPIVRIIVEAKSESKAEGLSKKYFNDITKLSSKI